VLCYARPRNPDHLGAWTLRPGDAAKGDQVIPLTDRFPANTEDRVWMDALGDEGGWVVISADRRIHRNKIEREAWRRSGLITRSTVIPWPANQATVRSRNGPALSFCSSGSTSL
jgi:hypothetical protein